MPVTRSTRLLVTTNRSTYQSATSQANQARVTTKKTTSRPRSRAMLLTSHRDEQAGEPEQRQPAGSRRERDPVPSDRENLVLAPQQIAIKFGHTSQPQRLLTKFASPLNTNKMAFQILFADGRSGLRRRDDEDQQEDRRRAIHRNLLECHADSDPNLRTRRRFFIPHEHAVAYTPRRRQNIAMQPDQRPLCRWNRLRRPTPVAPDSPGPAAGARPLVHSRWALPTWRISRRRVCARGLGETGLLVRVITARGTCVDRDGPPGLIYVIDDYLCG